MSVRRGEVQVGKPPPQLMRLRRTCRLGSLHHNESWNVSGLNPLPTRSRAVARSARFPRGIGGGKSGSLLICDDAVDGAVVVDHVEFAVEIFAEAGGLAGVFEAAFAGGVFGVDDHSAGGDFAVFVL